MNTHSDRREGLQTCSPSHLITLITLNVLCRLRIFSPPLSPGAPIGHHVIHLSLVHKTTASDSRNPTKEVQEQPFKGGEWGGRHWPVPRLSEILRISEDTHLCVRASPYLKHRTTFHSHSKSESDICVADFLWM